MTDYTWLKVNKDVSSLFQGSKGSVVEFTAMEYAGDSTLYIATDNGKVSAWDTRHNSCFMHWEADSTEIG